METVILIFNVIALLCGGYYLFELTNIQNFIEKNKNPESINMLDALAIIYTYIFVVICIFSISGVVALVYAIILFMTFRKPVNPVIPMIGNIAVLFFIGLNNLIFKINTWEILNLNIV